MTSYRAAASHRRLPNALTISAIRNLYSKPVVYFRRPTAHDPREPYLHLIFQFGNGFDKWPEHSVDRYVDPYKIGVDGKKGVHDGRSKIFYPQSRNKSMYTTSTIRRKLENAMSSLNWRTFDTVSFPADNTEKSRAAGEEN